MKRRATKREREIDHPPMPTSQNSEISDALERDLTEVSEGTEDVVVEN